MVATAGFRPSSSIDFWLVITDSLVHTGVMKTLPGIKIVSFLVLVAVLVVGVYAWAQSSKKTATPNMFIVKFGNEENPINVEPINYSSAEMARGVSSRSRH